MSTETPALAPAPALAAVTSATAALDTAMFDPNREGFTDITALVDAFAAARAAARDAGHTEEDIDAAATPTN
ncbi:MULTISPECIES: hypothetical protein [unclassified Rhodococcus (in: high G+C Gram-positive bacteria)]|uniref:hypothetical protein n=1 Tax=unclassified Rhodococcus (in: high G+C Gram-positive bacteria) TaxID=192944 RepID=UPI00096A6110|nr:MULTISPECIES: hypothetical protein [unclassified Rhodococcus (in: high G+C Gram-positive bacteria)]